MDNQNEKEKGKPFAKKHIVFGAIVLGIVVIAAVAAIIYFSNASDYVAKVGSEKVSKAEFTFYLNSVKQDILAKAQETTPNLNPNTFWNTKIDGENALDSAKKKALDLVKETKVQTIKAKEAKTTLDKTSEDYVNNYESQLAQQFGGDKTKAEDYIKQNLGINMTEFKQFLRENMLISTYRTKQMQAMKFSDDEIKKYYDDNKKSFDQVTVRHILYATVDPTTSQPLPADKQKAAEKKANDALAKIKAGADMQALVLQESEDPGAKQNNGEYTFGKYDSYVQEFKDWALKANVGDIGIVKSQFGYHVMKLEKREPTPLDQIKSNMVQNELAPQKYQKELDAWKNEYKIETNQSVYNAIK